MKFDARYAVRTAKVIRKKAKQLGIFVEEETIRSKDQHDLKLAFTGSQAAIDQLKEYIRKKS
jgi:hypothetical protein